jgi:hydroxymethylglutaryl-CoA reductase
MNLSGFYKLSIEERQKKIKEYSEISDEELKKLSDTGALKLELADRMIENVIGAIHLPLGVATNFRINGKDMMVPMAVEEPSIIAGASRAAKLTLPEGFKAEADDSVMIGQIQIVDIPDIDQARKNLENSRNEILDIARGFMKPHEKWGAGVVGFESKPLRIGEKNNLIVEFSINVSDAMGANMINTALEGIAPTIAVLSEGKVRLRIISNLATRRIASANAIWKKDVIGEDTINGIIDGYEFAKADVYRCATHNKGIMNGIDAVVLATGNDWRAVEAGAHAYASLGQYKPLTRFEKTEKGDLMGSIELPMAVATVGGSVNSSPTAKTVLKIADVKTSRELAMVCACAGLANNFAALSALAAVGIQSGHMKLHARNIAILAGAETTKEIDAVSKTLAKEKDYSSQFAKEVLDRIRAGG